MNTTSGRVKVRPVTDDELVDVMFQSIIEQRNVLVAAYHRLAAMEGYWVLRRITVKWRGKKFNYGRPWAW